MTNTVKLQGIYGEKQGTPTKNLKIGNIIIWNYGYKSKVVEIIPSKTGKTMTVMLESSTDGQIRPRKLGANRLLVVEQSKRDYFPSGSGAADPLMMTGRKEKENEKIVF